MSDLIHRTPSVGSVTKKLLALHPDLGAQEIIRIVKQATRRQGDEAGEFASAEIIDEALALELAGKARSNA